MDERTLEDLLVGIFDPLMTIEEKGELLLQYDTNDARSFEQAGFFTLDHGLVLEFADGSRFQILILPF